jgi:hypothetical protein
MATPPRKKDSPFYIYNRYEIYLQKIPGFITIIKNN